MTPLSNQHAEEHHMFERFDTPEEIFSYKLGSALSMERQLVDLLAQCTLREEIRHPLAVHREETLQHVANIEHCFTLLDEPVDRVKAPRISRSSPSSRICSTDTPEYQLGGCHGQ